MLIWEDFSPGKLASDLWVFISSTVAWGMDGLPGSYGNLSFNQLPAVGIDASPSFFVSSHSTLQFSLLRAVIHGSNFSGSEASEGSRVSLYKINFKNNKWAGSTSKTNKTC